MDINYFNPRDKIEKHIYRLPHWQQTGTMYFVTWHLADSLPKSVRHKISFQKQNWLKSHPKPWDAATSKEYHFNFTLPLEKYLDQGAGSCLLKQQKCAAALKEVMLKYQDIRYEVDTFVIMPNHVHALFQCLDEWEIQKILQQWKGVSSHEINRLQGSKPPLWQEGYWDRMIRSPEHLKRCRTYIRDNPKKAYLRAGEFILFEKKRCEDTERGHMS